MKILKNLNKKTIITITGIRPDFIRMHSIFKFDSHAVTDEIPISKEKSKQIFFISILYSITFCRVC